MPNDNRPDGRSPPGRHQSESPAGFDPNQVADINRNARPTSSESARKPRAIGTGAAALTMGMLRASVVAVWKQGTHGISSRATAS